MKIAVAIFRNIFEIHIYFKQQIFNIHLHTQQVDILEKAERPHFVKPNGVKRRFMKIPQIKEIEFNPRHFQIEILMIALINSLQELRREKMLDIDQISIELLLFFPINMRI